MLLILAKADGHRWRTQSANFERLYRAEVTAHAADTAAVRAATEKARQIDRANAARVARAQSGINERTANEFEARLADVRARAQRLRLRPDPGNSADQGRFGSARVPVLPTAAPGTDEAAGEERLSGDDALIATEQAIQLDELIKWVRAQSAIDRAGANPTP